MQMSSFLKNYGQTWCLVRPAFDKKIGCPTGHPYHLVERVTQGMGKSDAMLYLELDGIGS